MGQNPRDLTIGDCWTARHSVSVWCASRCPGRDLQLDQLGRWADRKLLDLMRDGVIVCSRCRQPATFVSVSAHLVADPILVWKVGDDALPVR
jgi:hypothetical protein